MRQGIIDAQCRAPPDDLRLREMHQGRVDTESQPPLDPGLGRQVSQLFECCDELGPAVGIAAVVDCVDADEEIGRT